MDLSEYIINTAAAILKCLGSTTRIILLDCLRSSPKNVGELAKEVAACQSAVSKHLQILRLADLVRYEKRHQQVVYSISPKTERMCQQMDTLVKCMLKKGTIKT